MSQQAELFSILQMIGPALAVYVGIRADMASMKIRLDHLEKDIIKMERHNEQKKHTTA